MSQAALGSTEEEEEAPEQVRMRSSSRASCWSLLLWTVEPSAWSMVLRRGRSLEAEPAAQVSGGEADEGWRASAAPPEEPVYLPTCDSWRFPLKTEAEEQKD